MGNVPSNFQSILFPDAMVVDNSASLDHLCEEYLRDKPRSRLGSYNAPDGSKPWASSEPLMSPTMNTKAENAAALRKSIFANCGMAAGGQSHEDVVLGLIQKILQKAGR